MIDLFTINKVDSFLDDVKSHWHWGLSIKGSDGLKMDENIYWH